MSCPAEPLISSMLTSRAGTRRSNAPGAPNCRTSTPSRPLRMSPGLQLSRHNHEDVGLLRALRKIRPGRQSGQVFAPEMDLIDAVELTPHHDLAPVREGRHDFPIEIPLVGLQAQIRDRRRAPDRVSEVIERLLERGRVVEPRIAPQNRESVRGRAHRDVLEPLSDGAAGTGFLAVRTKGVLVERPLEPRRHDVSAAGQRRDVPAPFRRIFDERLRAFGVALLVEETLIYARGRGPILRLPGHDVIAVREDRHVPHRDAEGARIIHRHLADLASVGTEEALDDDLGIRAGCFRDRIAAVRKRRHDRELTRSSRDEPDLAWRSVGAERPLADSGG